MAGDTVITVIGNLTSDPELRFTPNVYGFTNSEVLDGGNRSAGRPHEGSRALQFDAYGWDRLSARGVLRHTTYGS